MKDLKPRSRNQADYIRSISENIITIGHNIPACGKSMVAVGVACHYLAAGKVDTILISRSIITCGKDVCPVPGDIQSKVAPYMVPFLDYLYYFLGPRVDILIKEKKIILAPIEILRGTTFHNSFCILEEVQNCTPQQIKLFLTRLGQGEYTRAVLIGDENQCDIRENGLSFLLQALSNTENVGIIKFTTQDIQRHPIIANIIEKFEKFGV